MRILASILVLMAFGASAATNTVFRLHNTPSTISGYKCMDLALGPAGRTAISCVTTTLTAGTEIQLTDVVNGTALAWISEPFATAVNIQTGWTNNLYGGESGTGVNAAFRAKLFHYTNATEVLFGQADMAAELSTTVTTARNWVQGTGAPTNTLFAVGDRLVVKFYAIPVGGTMSTGTVTAHFEGPTDAADGSSWISIQQTATMTAEGGAGGTPSIVQRVGTAEIDNTSGTIGANGSAFLFLPNATLSGNAIVLFFRIGTVATTPTVTSDQGGTWLMGPGGRDASSSGDAYYCYYLPNAPAGTRRIQVKSSAAASYFCAAAYEVANMATASALDGSSATTDGTQTAPNSITAGSFTPTTSGDIIFQFLANGPPFNRTTNFLAGTAGSPNITWQLLTANLHDTLAVSEGVYSSTAAINPATSLSGSAASAMSSIAVAFKSSTSGATASGARIVGIEAWTVEPADETNQVPQFSPVGNTIVLATSAGGNIQIHGTPGDNLGQSYASCGAICQGNLNAVSLFYAANTTATNPLFIHFQLTNTSSDVVCFLVDMAGMATSPFGGGSDYVTNNFNETGITNKTLLTLTPSTASGVALAVTAIDFNTITNVASVWLLQNGYLGVNSQNTAYYENNGFASIPVTSASASPLTWSFQGGINADVGWMAGAAAFFQAPASGGGAAPDSRALLMRRRMGR